ncbi:forkhead box protein M1 isoform X2 [Callorhinchus milii]|uniref:forkhead box protein M1 isoform X2 n=1 Tax=Callorhinchus milii TaxID=7868 RepID=UPI001C3FCABE|nr:forkhead box protein M1 isoform X2 [Callorhinchus milii]
MKASPRRPLILKRRKRPLSFSGPTDVQQDPGRDEADGGKSKRGSSGCDVASGCPGIGGMGTSQHDPQLESQKFPEGIRIANHPSIPNTQVVVIPRNADLQSIIKVLTAKGKESGTNGPKKFILLSSNGSSSSRYGPSVSSKDPRTSETGIQPLSQGGGKSVTCQGEPDLRIAAVSDQVHPADLGLRIIKKEEELPSFETADTLVPLTLTNKEAGTGATGPGGPPLDDSLTNIQWLGKMSTDSLGACSVKEEVEKENQEPPAESSSVESVHERPPYSYMAMIQFAINSTQSKRMTLKEIYTWIEDHFPYFKHVAKPGWKNSIRHNLSLHDMFIRQTSHNGKISHWTIRAEANRFLTLDQVVKSPGYSPSEQAHWICATPLLLCQQQKRTGSNDLLKNPGAGSTVGFRKMKPLLPRTDSYLVPIPLSLNSPLILQPSTHITLPSLQVPLTSSTYTELTRRRKRIRIAPKVPSEPVTSNQPVNLMMDYQALPLIHRAAPLPTTACDSSAALRIEEALCKENTSRRKQRHVPQPMEEPVLLFPDFPDPGMDSGMASDLSTFHESRTLEQGSDFASTSADYNFKTPIKEKPFRDLPASSTPSKGGSSPSLGGGGEGWKFSLTPLKKEDSLFEFSPVRTPCGSFLTPLRNNPGYLSLSSTPFKDFAIFESPRELLNSPVKELDPHSLSPPLADDQGERCSRELLASSGPSANRSLTEGLVLDTLNDSLSKILLDLSFTGLEDEDYDLGNMSWSALIPELR